MGYINLLVGSDANINIKHNQLFLRNLVTGDEIDYPIEDINAIVIESLRSNITTSVLNTLSENNIATYFCNESHLPSAYLLKFNGFYKNLTIYNIQIETPKPLQKRLWQSIIRAKITNQSKALDYCGISNDLSSFCKDVMSGDISNIESVVALKYFKMIFGMKFNRKQENIINSALNYGYSIVRGAIARSVVAHGLLPFLGIHHNNQLNGFNLVDDLIEPFRPMVDLFVYKNFLEVEEDGLSPTMKKDLLGLLNANVKIKDKIYSLSNAIDLFVSSYIKCLTTKTNRLEVPEIMEFEIHKYE